MTVKRALQVFIAVFLLALPFTFPVTLVERWITLPPNVHYAPLTGSIFSIHTAWVSVDGMQVHDVGIRTSLTGFFTGTPLLLSAKQPVRLSAALGSSDTELQLADVRASAGSAELRKLLGMPGLGVDAAVVLEVSRAVLAGQRCTELDGQVHLRDFQGEGFSLIKEITGKLSCNNGSYMITLEPGNLLRLSGTATLFVDGRYQISMTAEPPQGPLFETFVDLLGKPRDGRRFQLNFRS